MAFTVYNSKQYGKKFAYERYSPVSAFLTETIHRYAMHNVLRYDQESYMGLNNSRHSPYNFWSGRDGKDFFFSKRSILDVQFALEIGCSINNLLEISNNVCFASYGNKYVMEKLNISSRIEKKEKLFTEFNMESSTNKNHFISYSIDEIFLYYHQEMYNEFPDYIKTYSPGIEIKNTIEYNAYKLNRLVKKIIEENNGYLFSSHGISSKYNDYKFNFVRFPGYNATLVYAIARGYEGSFRFWYQIAYNNNSFQKDILDNILRPTNKFLVKKKLEKKNGVFYTIEPGQFDNKYALVPNNMKVRTIINDLDLHYGEGFTEKHKHLKSILEDKNKNGVILLHGVPGSGKSNFLKHLISTTNAEFVYANINIIENIDNAQLSKLIKKMDGKIFIIEDAERLIVSRDDHYSKSGISGLLNYADGVIGDAIRIKFIITFNTSVSNIDPALKRHGRMLFEHKFDALDIHKSQKLLDVVRPGYTAKSSMTLSDIYHIDFDNYAIDKKPESSIL